MAAHSPQPTPAGTPDTVASLAYWSNIEPTVSGMLGGIPQVSRTDLSGSYSFFTRLRRRFPSTSTTAASSSSGSSNLSQRASQATHHDDARREPATSFGGTLGRVPRAVDCGAGIGRVTLGFLQEVAQRIDVVEPVGKFADEVRHGVSFETLRQEGRLGDVVQMGLQEWDPRLRIGKGGGEGEAADGRGEGEGYDLIWNQWCLGHMTDAQLVEYLARCAGALAPDGWIVVKENVTSSSPSADRSVDISGNRFDFNAPIAGDQGSQSVDEDIFDDEDSSVTRSDSSFRAIFTRAGLEVKMAEQQKGFPRELFRVNMYALRPVIG